MWEGDTRVTETVSYLGYPGFSKRGLYGCGGLVLCVAGYVFVRDGCLGNQKPNVRHYMRIKKLNVRYLHYS